MTCKTKQVLMCSLTTAYVYLAHQNVVDGALRYHLETAQPCSSSRGWPGELVESLDELYWLQIIPSNTQAADFVVNTGIGFAVGVVGSVLLFRRE